MKIITVILLMFGVISCSSCSKKEQVPVQIPAQVLPQPVTVSNQNFSLTLPNSDWIEIQNGTDNSKDFRNSKISNELFLAKDHIHDGYDQTIITIIRNFNDSGSKFVSAKQVMINNHKFAAMEFALESVTKELVWLCVEGDFLYIFYCTLPSSSTNTVCYDIANTIKIN